MVEVATDNEVLKYGHYWPEGSSDANIELCCYREMRLDASFQTGHTKGFHFEKAIDYLWPERMPDGRRCYIKSPWSEKRIQSWCKHQFQTWWGAGATGKTKDAAIIVMTHYLSAPDRTAISVCSTDKKMLMRRIFGELVTLYYCYGSELMPMEFLRGDPAFKFKMPGQSKSTSTNAGIFGVAVVAGEVEKAVGKIQGAHNCFSSLVYDELAVSYARVFEEGWDNLSAGCVEAKCLGIGNPIHKMDPLCKNSKPKHGGWDSISTANEEWETEKGTCLYFDGLKSPGVTDPKRYPFLLNQKQIDDMKKDPGENSPRFWTMRRGFMPPDGLIKTLFSASLIAQHNLQRREMKWARNWTWLAALDEAFSADGDRCMMVTARVGMSTEGLMMIMFHPEIAINLQLSDKEAMEYYIVREVKQHCEALGISRQNFGIDITGSQVALGSIFEHEWGTGIFRCQFGGAPTDTEISRDDKSGKIVTAKDLYANRVTELWYNVRRFAINGQVAGMSEEAAAEACQRVLLNAGDKIRVEDKKEMRKRTGQSPDIFDGYAIIVAMAMERFGMRPGTNNFGDEVADQMPDEVRMAVDPDAERNMYSEDQVGTDEDGPQNYDVDSVSLL